MTTKVESSKFEWIASGDVALKPDFDIPVLETESFVVLPSLGSLTIGWLLAVPRRKMPNLSWLSGDERGEIRSLIAIVKARLSALEGNVFGFEHGGAYGSLTNCGVDQAHLHLVPLSFDLLSVAREQTDVRWSETVDREYVAPQHTGQEYLSAFSVEGHVLQGVPDEPKSQWFRRLIAAELGKVEWDYKVVPDLTTLRQTVAAVGQ